jgi:hypothetical protein
MGLRRLIQAQANAKYKRVERLEMALDRLAGLRPRTGHAARLLGICAGCGESHELETPGCVTCKMRHYNRERRAA